jgi:FkbM family methyltransferase
MSLSAKSGSLNQAPYKREGEFPARLRLMRLLGRKSWITHGTDSILRKLHDPDSSNHFRFEVDFFGFRYRGDLANYIDWVVFCYGGSPLMELTLLRDLASEIRKRRSGPIICCDVGANVGHHTLFMAGIAEQVLSFEPFAGVRRQIEDKLALNDITNVRLFPFALGLEDEELTYYPGIGANSGIGTFLANNASQDHVSHVLPVRQGDKLFEEEKLPALDILKVDVEGFEANVFRGLKGRIHKDRPAILTEVLDASRSLIGGEAAFRSCFYEGAIFAGVEGRLNSAEFQLKPFDYEKTDEVVIVPPEMGDFIRRRIQ